MQGGPGISRHVDGMLEGLRNAAGDRPRLVHRLDRDTTGVLLIARTPGVAAKLAAAFRGRDMEKTYWAVVAGRPVPVEGEIDLPLEAHRRAIAANAPPRPNATTRTPPAPSPNTAPWITRPASWPGWN